MAQELLFSLWRFVKSGQKMKRFLKNAGTLGEARKWYYSLARREKIPDRDRTTMGGVFQRFLKFLCGFTLFFSLNACFVVSNRAELAPPINDDPKFPNTNPLPINSENHTPSMTQRVSSSKYYGFVLLESNSPQGSYESDSYRLLNQTLFLNADAVDFSINEGEN